MVLFFERLSGRGENREDVLLVVGGIGGFRICLRLGFLVIRLGLGDSGFVFVFLYLGVLVLSFVFEIGNSGFFWNFGFF